MAGDPQGDLLTSHTPDVQTSVLAEEKPSDPTPAAPARRRWRSRKIAWFVGIPAVLALVVGIGVGVAAWRVQTAIDQKIERFEDPFKNIPAAARPTEAEPVAATTAMDLLVFGSDSRISAGDPSQWQAGAQRTDAIMLVHIPADRKGAYVISIPRDSWVTVPGHGKAKINAAFSWGGPSLAIATVEQLTGVKIDHMVVTDFTGFARITDLLGGVTVTLPKKTNIGNGKQTLDAGTHLLDGETALAYVRERYTLPGGDLDRVKRQQNWMRAIMRSAASSGVQKDPQRLMAMVDALATHLSTDEGFTIEEMRKLVLSLRDVGTGGAKYMTVPVAGTGWSPDGKQSIVKLDNARAKTLWKAVADDEMSAWTTKNTGATLGETVR